MQMLQIFSKVNALFLGKLKKFSSPLSPSCLLDFLFIFTLVGCNWDSSSGKTTYSATIDAETPVITIQLSNATYSLNEQAVTISVEVEVSDNGILSYQWYSNSMDSNNEGVEISGEINDTYTPPTDVFGTTYYYVKVINTNTDASRNKTVVTVSDTVKIDVGYAINFYDNDLNLNQSTVVFSEEINLANYNPFATLYEANGSTDISSNTAYNMAGNTNLYALSNVQEIRTETELDNVRNNLSGKYILLNDIVLTSATLDTTEGWLPIGDSADSFTGVFEGNGYKISNLWINKISTDHIGLFGYINNAQIKNLGLETDNSKSGVKGGRFVGGIAGSIYSSNITNSYFIGNISISNANVGGIAGYIHSSNIINSYSSGDINGNFQVGGIAGYVIVNSNITNSHSVGNISGDGQIGGIAGDTNGNIKGSYSARNVNGSNNIGGIAGVNFGNIMNSYSTGDINGTDNIGGIVGHVQIGNIANSYSIGNVSGNDKVGGIAGVVDLHGIIQYNVAINPSINGSHEVNRVVGFVGNDGTVSDNLALEDMLINGSHRTDGNDVDGTGKPLEDLKTKSTYENLGWSFGNDDANPWRIDDNNSYPYLYWEE
ncbi:MAG: hypothetical protein LBI78_07030 [Campylobacteraceae bacterium]|jgi:hypothetical protein|nr:hypothetical protein [Campylobacteraceae bacterium]